MVSDEKDEAFKFVYLNEDTLRITKTVTIVDIMTVQCLKLTTHVCREENVTLAKMVLFALPTERSTETPSCW